jgi:serine/threonine protein kinase/Tfp pilus assembly protein PilF
MAREGNTRTRTLQRKGGRFDYIVLYIRNGRIFECAGRRPSGSSVQARVGTLYRGASAAAADGIHNPSSRRNRSTVMQRNTPTPAELPSGLAGRYVIQREIGRGAAAVVYVAQDLKHDRIVALKMLLPELSESVRKDRFLREIQIAAKLTHPHIVPLYDSGEIEGRLFYVMPYVEGESLRERLARERQLPLAEALRITREVASALAYAHAHGVVHRDIKPENILLQDGLALVSDFGIAHALSAAVAGGDRQIGVAYGTPDYMSPEQASGTDELDARSDIYSLGCVLYEMLAGHPPFTGASAQEILARHALDPVPKLAAARPEVPADVESAVRTALSRTPADRFATAAEFAARLSGADAHAVSRGRRRVALAVAALILIVAIFIVILRRDPVPVADRSIAVLPFVNLSSDPQNEYLSDGISEDVINALAQLPTVRVAARTSSFAFKGRNTDVADIARRLNSRLIVEGSVRRDGNRIRVVAQLINATDGYHLWSGTFEREFRDVWDVQEEVARAIASALELELATADSTRLALRYSSSPEAYDQYLNGRYFWNKRNPAAVAKAIEYFTRALDIDSSFALAYSGLSDAYIIVGATGTEVRADAYSKAKASALRAVALAPDRVEPHLSLARVRENVDWDWAGAENENKAAIRLSPRSAYAHNWYGQLLARTSRRDADAIREANLGVDLDPLSAPLRFNLGMVYLMTGNFGLASPQFSKAIELDPGWVSVHERLAYAYALLGRFDDAVRASDAARNLDPKNPRNLLVRAHILALQGRPAEAKLHLGEYRKLGARVSAYELAEAYGAVGEVGTALGLLEQSIRDHTLNYGYLRFPAWDAVRKEPRFLTIVRRLNLPP